MREQLEQRLQELRSEFEAGQKVMVDLETQQTNLRTTLLRISGAIQVLQEELDKVAESNGAGKTGKDEKLTEEELGA